MLAVLATAAGAQPLLPDAPIHCEACAEWNEPQEPFRVFGNTYYVGTAGLSSLLLVSDRGHVLLDGALPQSAPLIADNIRALGFRLEDVRLIVSSHAHYDHVGGVAALQRASGAEVVASAASAAALRRGEPLPDDPQWGFGAHANRFPAVADVRIVADGEVVRSDLGLTAHLTPGHTPGGTSWSWRSCEAERCRQLVYADSLTAVAAPGFRFAGERAPGGLLETFRGSIARVAALPCEVLIAPHPGFIGLADKLEGRRQGVEPDPFLDPEACRNYAAAAGRGLDRRVEREREAESSAHQLDGGR